MRNTLIKKYWYPSLAIRIGIIGFIVILLWILLSKCNNSSAGFVEKLDSLSRVNNLLVLQNKKADSLITELKAEDIKLTDLLEDEKRKIKVIRDVIIKEIEVVKAADSSEIVKFFNHRYPAEANLVDTFIPLNKPVLIGAAEDLLKYDGAVKEIVIKDSIIELQGSRINLKDNTISLFETKESNFTTIISNKDLAIDNLSRQYKSLQRQNKKLKLQNKFQKIGALLLAGGVVYFIAK